MTARAYLAGLTRLRWRMRWTSPLSWQDRRKLRWWWQLVAAMEVPFRQARIGALWAGLASEAREWFGAHCALLEAHTAALRRTERGRAALVWLGEWGGDALAFVAEFGWMGIEKGTVG
jgi:hypothetical protein